MQRSRRLLLAVTAGLMTEICSSGVIEASGRPVSYTLPKETTAFKPGPNFETVRNNCTGCHSADYVQIQPRGAKFKEDFWRAEVNKMVKVYGASIDEADIGPIVDYLTQTYR
jgi:hypothetical protein